MGFIVPGGTARAHGGLQVGLHTFHNSNFLPWQCPSASAKGRRHKAKVQGRGVQVRGEGGGAGQKK